MHTLLMGDDHTDVNTNIICKDSDVASKWIETQLIHEIDTISALMYMCEYSMHVPARPPLWLMYHLHQWGRL